MRNAGPRPHMLELFEETECKRIFAAPAHPLRRKSEFTATRDSITFTSLNACEVSGRLSV